MDDSALPLACTYLPDPPPWVSVRNASDPQMTGGTVKDEAKHAARFRCRWPIRPKRGVVSPIPNRAEA